MERSATALASSSLKRSHSAPNAASAAARTLGITGISTARTCGAASRARATNSRTFSAVCSAFV